MAVVAAFGITASAVMFGVVEHLERFRAEAHFQQVAEQRLSVVRTNVADALDTISLLASHFEATGEAGTSRQAFSTLVAPALAKHRYIQALEWIPRVEGAERPDYERQPKDLRRQNPLGKEMAPQVGLEPTTLRLTAGCSAIELLRSTVTARSPGSDPVTDASLSQVERGVKKPRGSVLSRIGTVYSGSQTGKRL